MLMAATGVVAGDVTNDTTLRSCLESAESEVKDCKLTTDVSLVLSSDVTVVGTKTLDLNGKTLTITGTANSVKVGNNVSLTIKNGTVDATGTSSANVKVFVVDGKGTLVIDEVTLKGAVDTNNTATVRAVNDGGTIKVDNSKFIGASVLVGDNAADAGVHGTKNVKVTITNTTIDNAGFALSVNGNVSKQANALNTITLEGNTFTSDGIAMYSAGYAVWEIKSGTYTGTDVMNIRSGKVTISGGTLSATGAHADLPTNTTPGYALSFGAAVGIVSDDISGAPYVGQVELYVTGGTLESAYGNAIYEAKYTGSNNDDLKEISITGGTFKSGDDATAVVWLSNAKTNYVKGGTFIPAREDATPLQDGAVDERTAMEGTDKDGNKIVGKPVTIKVTNIGGLDEFNYTRFKTIKAAPGSQVDLLQLLGIGGYDENGDFYTMNGIEPDSKSHRYGVEYKLSNGTTGLDVFTMVANKDVTIELTLVEVDLGAEPSEDIPTTPAPGTDPGTVTPGTQEPGTTDPGTTDEDLDNPNTLDNVTSVAAMGGISLAIAAAGIATLKKREN